MIITDFSVRGPSNGRAEQTANVYATFVCTF
jgi:hypothetical protein